MRRLPPLLLLAACQEPPTTSAQWLQGFSVDWAGFNHRVSYLSLRPGEDSVAAAFVGGASTTGVIFDDDGCLDAQRCAEFPLVDPARISARVQRVASDEVLFGTATGSLRVDRDGGETTLTVPLPARASFTPVAWIGGITVDPSVALPAPAASCYDPRHGWMPTWIHVDVGAARLVEDDLAVQVPLSATFEAGASFEEARACLDAVYEGARADVTVDVVVAVSRAATQRITVSRSASWPDVGEDQSLEVLGDLSVDLDDPTALVGWAALDFRFHQQVEPGRGAYLRSLRVDLDAAARTAVGFATNTSTIAQLSGFDYAFQGAVVAVAAGVASEVTTYADSAVVPTFDTGGRPVISQLPPVP